MILAILHTIWLSGCIVVVAVRREYFSGFYFRKIEELSNVDKRLKLEMPNIVRKLRVAVDSNCRYIYTLYFLPEWLR